MFFSKNILNQPWCLSQIIFLFFIYYSERYVEVYVYAILPKMSLPLMLAAATSAVTAGRPPAVYDDAKFEVQAELGVPYAMGVLCNATTYGEGCGNGSFTEAPYDCSVCQAVEPQTTPPLTPTADCVAPRLFNLTLDMYTPIGVKASLGPRPAIVLTHEGTTCSLYAVWVCVCECVCVCLSLSLCVRVCICVCICVCI